MCSASPPFRPRPRPCTPAATFISARDAARICLIGERRCPGGRVAIPRFDPASGTVELADTAAAFLAARGRRAVFVDTPEAAAALEPGSSEGYPCC